MKREGEGKEKGESGRDKGGEIGGGLGGGGGRGGSIGGRSEKEGREERNIATSTGFVQRWRMERLVGKDGQSKRCWTV